MTYCLIQLQVKNTLKINNMKYIINAPDSLKYITEPTTKILDIKVKEYESFFEVEKYRDIIINYFDNINDFRKFIYKLRGNNTSLPEYAEGTYDNGMINAFIDPNIPINSGKYNIKLHMASHELFHIMYMELVLKNNYAKRIIWFDEGMAQLFSGEFDSLNDENNFKDFYLSVRKETKLIPNLNSIDHGESFCNEKYNGYNLSYLAVRYLYEIMDSNTFKKLISDTNKILEIGKTVVKKAFCYYEEKFK